MYYLACDDENERNSFSGSSPIKVGRHDKQHKQTWVQGHTVFSNRYNCNLPQGNYQSIFNVFSPLLQWFSNQLKLHVCLCNMLWFLCCWNSTADIILRNYSDENLSNLISKLGRERGSYDLIDKTYSSSLYLQRKKNKSNWHELNVL